MNRLLELRKARNLSQAALAEILHVTQQSICKYELSQAEPDITTLKLMADFFHTSIDYLVEYDGNAISSSDETMILEGAHLSNEEIIHLIEYRKLSDVYKKHIDNLIYDLTNN